MAHGILMQRPASHRIRWSPTVPLPPASPPAVVPGTRQPPSDQLIAAAQPPGT